MKIYTTQFSPKDALLLSMIPLTLPYLDSEHWMIPHVLSDLKRGGIRYMLVNEYDAYAGKWGITIARDSAKAIFNERHPDLGWRGDVSNE